MKKYFTLSLLLSVFICFGQQENYNYKFTYKVSVQPDAINNNIIDTENMSLFVGKKSSIYISPTKLIIDSARVAIKKRGGSYYELSDIKQAHPKNKIQSSIKKNYRIKDFIFQNNLMLKTFEFPRTKLPVFNWKITNTTNTLLGYKCLLATLTYKGRNYKAWFSTSIPIQDGPWKFYGLPGLIFKIADTQDHYSFTLIEIIKETKKMPQQKVGNKVIKVTSKTYLKSVKAVFNKHTERAIGESRIRMKKTAKSIGTKKGNPIELE
ncbi:GLPGLI family protein [Tenacibaculum insulae]|uniref:GLPGLI family protein n=1 Tax=Tenacibaculum insulae TaxID=2029677 RepID=UPI003AB3ACA6